MSFFFQYPPKFYLFKERESKLQSEIDYKKKELEVIQKQVKEINDFFNPRFTFSVITLKNSRKVIKGGCQIFDEYGKKHRVSLFIGSLSEFPNGKEDEMVKTIAQMKLHELLKKKFLRKFDMLFA
jgi:hypothetical protein